jgi:hypothetical protein
MPDALTRRDLAAACGVSARTITDWVAAGLPVTRAGRALAFDCVAVIGWLAQRATHQASRLDLNQERANLARVQAERQSLALAREKRAVIGIKVAADHWINHLLIARSRLLSLPNQLAAECAADADARMALRTVADRIVRRVLTELSEAPVLPPGDDNHDGQDQEPLGGLRGQDRVPARRPRRVHAADDEGGAAPGRRRAGASRPTAAPDR